MGKSTWDVAVLLGGMSAIKADPRDNATISAASSAKSDYVQFLTTSFSGIKLGVPNPDIFFNASYTGSQQIVDEAFAAITKMVGLFSHSCPTLLTYVSAFTRSINHKLKYSINE